MSILILSAITFSLASTSFSDLSGHWAEANIKKLASNGIVEGYTDGKFKPEGTVTYGEFIKMLVVAVTGENPGVAENSEHWASSYYDVAVTEGLLVEDDIPESYLSKSIPRADMAYLVANSIDTILEPEEAVLVEKYITDISKTGNRKSEVIYAYGTGILAGYPDGSFKPSGVLTRAESAAVISRTIDSSLRLVIDFEQPAPVVPTPPTVPVEPVVPTIPTDKLPVLTKDTNLDNYILEIPDSVKLPIDEVASNLNDNIKRSIKYYVIAENNPYYMYITYSFLDEEDISMAKSIAKSLNMCLIKDNKIIHNTQTITYQGVTTYFIPDYDPLKLPDFDYLGFYQVGNLAKDTMILIPNSLK